MKTETSKNVKQGRKQGRTFLKNEGGLTLLKQDRYYVYMVRCCDSTLYIGSTNDVEKRIVVHNAGKGAKYTRGRLPVQLLYSESFNTKSEALKREVQLKRFSRKQKLALLY